MIQYNSKLSSNGKSCDADDRRDSGITLIELLVYILLFGIVSAIIATFLIRTLQTQAKITNIQQANATNQTLQSALDIAIRNSSPKMQDTNVVPGLASGDQLLYVSNLQRASFDSVSNTLSSVDWMCSYWYYDDSEGIIYHKQNPSAIPATYNPDNWSMVASDILDPASQVFNIDVRSWDTTPSPTPTPTSTTPANELPPVRVAVDVKTESNGNGPDIRITSIYSGIGVDGTTAIPCAPGS